MRSQLAGIRLALALTGVMGAAGCVSFNKAYPINRVAHGVDILPLHRNEYEILGDTEGHACANYLLGGKLPWFSGAPIMTVNRFSEEPPSAAGSFLVSIPLFGSFIDGNRSVINEAVYKALEQVPEADALLSVRIKQHKRTNIPFIYNENCIDVKGKAFKIKTDFRSNE